MSVPIIVALLGVGAAAVSGGTVLVGRVFVERPHNVAQGRTAQEQADSAADEQMLSEVKYWRSLVMPLRSEVADLTAQMHSQSSQCHDEIEAVRAAGEYTIGVKDREIRALETQVARLLLRVDTLEQQTKGNGNGTT